MKYITLMITLTLASLGFSSCNTLRENDIIRHKVVRIFSEKGMCTGEQIEAPSGATYILTAAHCRGLMDTDGSFSIKTEEGSELKRKFIAEDPYSDLLLIEGLPNKAGLKIAKTVRKHDHARAFTHGGNFDTWKSEGEMIQDMSIQVPLYVIDPQATEQTCSAPKNQKIEVEGIFGGVFEICLLSVKESVSTVYILPGSSGGPIVNDSGELIGVASASDGRLAFLVRLVDINAFLAGY